MANLQSLFLEFNVSKFVVYSCLLCFTILLALRLDGSIGISYWAVFMPLWVWKTLVVIGAVIGTAVWARNPEYRSSQSSYISFKSMLISLSLQLLLLMFELLVCDKLDSGRHLWTLAFIPLLFVSLLSVAITVWSLRHERAFELELFCAVNVLQFLFIALRLDNLLTWSWVVVFIPFWVLITLAVIAVLYALIFAAILLRTPEVGQDQRRASFHSAVSYSLVVMPLVLFLVLLSNKLDQQANTYGQQSLSSLTTHHFSHFPYSQSLQPAVASVAPESSHHHQQQPLIPLPALVTGNRLTPASHDHKDTGHDPLFSHPLSSASSPHLMQTQMFPPLPQLPPPLQSHISNNDNNNNYGASPAVGTANGDASERQMSYFTVCCPLYLAFLILICLSFGSRGGNLWWFGMRRDFCSFLLTLCPCLQEYGNISFLLPYSKHTSGTGGGGGQSTAAPSPAHETSSPSGGEEEDDIPVPVVDGHSGSERLALDQNLSSEKRRSPFLLVLSQQPLSAKKQPHLMNHSHLHITIESPD